MGFSLRLPRGRANPLGPIQEPVEVVPLSNCRWSSHQCCDESVSDSEIFSHRSGHRNCRLVCCLFGIRQRIQSANEAHLFYADAIISTRQILGEAGIEAPFDKSFCLSIISQLQHRLIQSLSPEDLEPDQIVVDEDA